MQEVLEIAAWDCRCLSVRCVAKEKDRHKRLHLKKNYKNCKKKHSHSYALSARNRIVIDRQALATGARDVLAVKPLRY